MRNSKFNLSIITFTNVIALAYVYELNDEVHVHEQWSNTKYRTSVKPRSDILLDENDEAIAFGNDAVRMFRN